MQTIEITHCGETIRMEWDGAQASASIRVDGKATQYQTADARHDLDKAVRLACEYTWGEIYEDRESAEADGRGYSAEITIWDDVEYHVTEPDLSEWRASRPELITSWDSTDWCIYAEWRIEFTSPDGETRTVDVGCCIGVPDYLRATAKAAGTHQGVASAWYEHPDDWRNELSNQESNVVLDAMERFSVSLWSEHGGQS